MTWEELSPTVRLVDGHLDDGRTTTTIWRTEVELNRVMVDASPWCASPARASALGRELRDRWSTFRRWTPDRQEVDA